MTVTPISRPRTVNEERVNGYVCVKCHYTTWTIDVDEGVTPMFLRCKRTSGCLGRGYSLCYTVPVNHPEPDWEWYKPSKAQARRQEKKWPGSLQHWRQGGLSLRPRTQVGKSDAASGVTS